MFRQPGSVAMLMRVSSLVLFRHLAADREKDIAVTGAIEARQEPPREAD